MPETNPLVAERKDTTTPLAGTFLLEDGEALVQAINDKDWVAGGLAVLGGAFDAAAAASDPIGTLIAMGLGWVLDHVQPFNTWLEQLTGDADQVKAHAATWKNVHKHLQATAETMASHVTTDLADMNGRTITAYQGAAGDITRVINAAGTWAGAIGTALEVTAFIVQFVHDFVRDAISEVVGSILSYAAELIATVGLAWPIVAEQIATRIASLIGQVGRNVKNLVTSARNLVKKLTDLKTLFHTLKNKIDDLFRKGDNPGNTGQNTSKTADNANSTTGSGGADHPGESTGSGGGTGPTGGNSGTGNTGSSGSSTHPGGASGGPTTPTGSSADYSKGTPHPSDGKTNNTAPTDGAPAPSTGSHPGSSHASMTADSAPSTNNSTTLTGSGADYSKGTPHPSDGKTNNTASAGVASNSSVGATSPGEPSIRSNENLGSPDLAYTSQAHPSSRNIDNAVPVGATAHSSVGAASPGGLSAHSSENLGSSSLGGGNSTHHPAGGANAHLTDNNVTSPHDSSSHTNSGTGHTSGSSGAGSTGSPGSSTHPSGTSSGSTTPTTGPGHTSGNTNPTSGANTPTHADGSHAAMTADNAPSTNNSTTHTGSTTGPDGPPGHTTGEPNPTQTSHTTGEPDTPKRALDDDPTTHPTDPVTVEPRHAEEPPETSSSGGDDGNNHGGGDDHNNHNNDGDDHNNHNNDGDDGNNHGDGDGDTELERLRDQPSETIDDVRQINEELPSHYTGEHAEVGKALDDGYGLIDDPTHHFGTNPETGLPNSYNDWAEKYRIDEQKCAWPKEEVDGPVQNGMIPESIDKNCTTIDKYLEKYGDRLDRIGDPNGTYFGGVDGDHVASFAERSIDPRSACKPYYQYQFTGHLPEGYRIETGTVAPWHDAPGGARQVQIYDKNGKPITADAALEKNILRGVADFVGLP